MGPCKLKMGSPRIADRRGRSFWSSVSLLWLISVFLLSLIILESGTVAAKEYKVLVLSMFTANNVSLEPEEYYPSFMVVPIAIQHFNQRSGSILPQLPSLLRRCNATLRLSFNTLPNDRATSTVAMSILVKALTSPTEVPDFILGPTKSEVAQTVAITAGAMGIPMIGYATTAQSLTNRNVYTSFFRATQSDAQGAEKMASLFEHFGFLTVALVHTNDAYGTGYRDALTDAAASRGILVRAVFFDSAKMGDDLVSQIRQNMRTIVRERINVIVQVTTTLAHDLAILQAAIDLKWVTGKLYIGRRGFTQEMNQLAVQNATIRQALVGSLSLLFEYDTTNLQYENLENKMPSFNVSYINSFLPESATPVYPGFFAERIDGMRYNAPAYDSIIAMGIAACAGRSSTKSLVDRVAATNFSGASGQLRFDSNYDRDPAMLYFRLENLVANVETGGLTPVTVASTVDGEWVFTTPILFSNGGTSPPMDVVRRDPVVQYIPTGAKVFGWIEVFASFVLVLIALVTVVRRWSQPIVQKSNPILLLLMMLAMFLTGSSILPLTFESDVACMVYPWLFSLGLSSLLLGLSLMATTAARRELEARMEMPTASRSTDNENQRNGWCCLCRTRSDSSESSKNSEENPGNTDLKRRRRPRRPTNGREWSPRCKLVLVRSLEIIVWFLFVSVLVTLVVFQCLAPISLVIITIQVDADGYPTTVVPACVSTSDMTTPILVALLVLAGALAVIAVFSTLWLRNVAVDQDAPGMLLIAALCICQVFFVGLPAAIAVWTTTLSRFLVLSSVSFVLVIIVFVAVFATKFIVGWRLFPSNVRGIEEVERAWEREEVLSQKSNPSMKSNVLDRDPSVVVASNSLASTGVRKRQSSRPFFNSSGSEERSKSDIAKAEEIVRPQPPEIVIRSPPAFFTTAMTNATASSSVFPSLKAPRTLPVFVNPEDLLAMPHRTIYSDDDQRTSPIHIIATPVNLDGVVNSEDLKAIFPGYQIEIT